MSYKTTKLERAPRINAIAHDFRGSALDSGASAVQEVLEAGALALRDRDGLPGQVNALISAVLGAIDAAESPCFEVGDQVSSAGDASPEPAVIGKVRDRYLNERGEWEYQVHHPRYGTNPYREDEIAPVS